LTEKHGTLFIKVIIITGEFDCDPYLAPIDYSNVKFWFVCRDGIMGYSNEESCKHGAEYYGVLYHKFDGEFGYFEKGRWVKVLNYE